MAVNISAVLQWAWPGSGHGADGRADIVAQRRLAPGPCGDVATAGRENASLLRCYCVANVLLKCCGDVATAGRENPGTHHGPYRQQASLKKPLPVFRYHVKPLHADFWEVGPDRQHYSSSSSFGNSGYLRRIEVVLTMCILTVLCATIYILNGLLL